MIVYLGNKQSFIRDALDNVLADRLDALFIQLGIGKEGAAEFRSWRSSLPLIALVLTDNRIHDNVQVALEYQVPSTSKRVDFMLGGKTDGANSLIIVELKQWETCTATDKENIVRTFIAKKEREVVHPSHQAYSYAKLLANFNGAVQDNNLQLIPCVYLHNFEKRQNADITDSRYREVLDKAPLFFKRDGERLREFFAKYAAKPSDKPLFSLIEHGKIRPSKPLQDMVGSILRGNQEFEMIDEQQVAYATVLQLIEMALKDNRKHTIIIEGGPGTGKSVIAVNLLAKILRDGRSCAYVTKTSAPRKTFSRRLTKGSTKLDYLSQGIFMSSGAFIEDDSNKYDCLIVDEAHRLVEKSGMYRNLGENQVKEIIHASKVSVFFIDEDQVVTMQDFGSIREIKQQAQALGSVVHAGEDLKLVSQFRCNGSDGYMAFLDDLLGIRPTANRNYFDLDYDFRIFDNACEMREELRKYNDRNKARMIAGYCYPWVSDKDRTKVDIVLPGGFEAQWNFSTDSFATDSDSFEQVGCIHSTQGLEFDYAGVIIGNDLRYEAGHIITDYKERYRKRDKTIGKVDTAEKQTLADRIIRNTYKVLLSRGQKGTFVYCQDAALCEHLKERLRRVKETAALFDLKNWSAPNGTSI